MKSSGKDFTSVAFGAAIVIGALTADTMAQTRTAPGPFTDAQAQAGHAAYAQSCAACHLNNLGGASEAPPLAGAAFMGNWRNRTTQDLFTGIKAMPLDNPGSLSGDAYASLLAFLLKANGATAGTTPFTPATAAVRIGAVATGQLPREIAQARTSGPAPAPAATRRLPRGSKEGVGARW